MFKADTLRKAIWLPVLLAQFLTGTLTRAAEPVVWEMSSRVELLKGEAHGVSVTDNGSLMLAPKFDQLFSTEQPYIWSTAIDAAGNVYLGTGHDGKIYRVTPDGKGTLLNKVSELDVTALVVGRDGSLYAGTSPDGKVYRLTADGKSEVYFDPHEKYIWSLAMWPDGSLAVGTGDKGKLYRVKAAGSKAEDSLLFATNQTHVISLAMTTKGDLIAGTDPGGLVLRISPDGKAFGLYDAPLREIHSLAAAPDGSIYALALGEATATTRAASVAGTSGAEGSAAAATAAGVSIVTAVDETGAAQINQPTPPARSRNDLSGAKAAVLRILPDGGTDVLWSSTSVTAFAVAPAPQGGVLVGTSDKGRIYLLSNDGRDTLLLQSTEGQISALTVHGADVFAASSNQGKLFRFGKDVVSDGSYESPVRDAKLVASWGRIWWRGHGPVQLQTRSGNSERPDATWSDWSTVYKDAAGSQVESPRARFIQWRAVLRNSTSTGEPILEDVSVVYLPRNVAPEVLAITILPPGVGLQQQIQLPLDPNIESTGLDPSLFGAVPNAPPRRVYQRGARSLQWQAEDRNGDTLEYAVYYRSLNETTFRLLKDHVRENFFTLDGASLADGRYVFKIVASDAPDNPAAYALSGERVSEPIDIDNTPPSVRQVGNAQISGEHLRAAFDVEDATGRIKRADVSIDGGAWREVFPDDGIADSAKERYSLDLSIKGDGEHTVALRAFDNSGNIGTATVVVRH
jgi:WD40 repeat protein